ncbi:MAG: hypothetical protein R8G66_15095 [Cytophagales bacterium]|nr:hypothetical protein [Cytophagales bacterium]
MKKSSFLLLILLLLATSLVAQEEEEEKKKTTRLSGYLKDMVSMNILPSQDDVAIDNLIHNRLNFRWFPSQQFQFRLEVRNRIFFGDFVSQIPNYGEFIDVNDDYFDASILVVDKNDLVIHSMIDRAYAEWKQESWSLSVGRQRINWGVNLAWNPNDIFNAYSFFDFDYEERPGSDAIRFQKYRGYAGGYEIAVSMADELDEVTAAYLYKWNQHNYDFQVLSGVMRNNFVLGGGWAGSIGNAGFKGEMTYFEPLGNTDQRTFLASISGDYVFANSLYLNGSILFNSAPITSGSLLQASTANLDVRSLSPYRYSAFLQASFPAHPLFNVGISTMTFPGNQGVFINPFLTWSMLSNLDLDLIGQIFAWSDSDDVYVMYARVKWSF